MTQIYRVKVSFRERYVLDEKEGMVMRRERILQPADEVTITDPKYGTFEVQPDGTFHVPDEVAAHFLRMPDWNEGANPFVVEDVIKPEVRKVEKAEVKEPKEPKVKKAKEAASA